MANLNGSISSVQTLNGGMSNTRTLKGSMSNTQTLDGGMTNIKTSSGGTTDYRNLKNKPSINDVELTDNKTLDDLGIQPKGEYATETFVTNKIAEAQLGGEGGNVDLSGYATKDELNNKVDKISGKSLIADTEIERLSKVDNYDDTEIKSLINTKANASAIPTKVSQLTNDKNYLSSIPSEYVTETELNNKGYLTSVPNEYVTETELAEKKYATETFVTEKIAEAEIGSGGIANETDPTVPSYVKSITEEDIAKWNAGGSSSIVESGKNANGSYIKFSDGTMICRHKIQGNQFACNKILAGYCYGDKNNFTENVKDWTFPQQFISEEDLTIQLTVLSNGYTSSGLGTTTVSGTRGFCVMPYAADLTAFTWNFTATGYWK